MQLFSRVFGVSLTSTALSPGYLISIPRLSLWREQTHVSIFIRNHACGIIVHWGLFQSTLMYVLFILYLQARGRRSISSLWLRPRERLHLAAQVVPCGCLGATNQQQKGKNTSQMYVSLVNYWLLTHANQLPNTCMSVIPGPYAWTKEQIPHLIWSINTLISDLVYMYIDSFFVPSIVVHFEQISNGITLLLLRFDFSLSGSLLVTPGPPGCGCLYGCGHNLQSASPPGPVSQQHPTLRYNTWSWESNLFFYR